MLTNFIKNTQYIVLLTYSVLPVRAEFSMQTEKWAGGYDEAKSRISQIALRSRLKINQE
jgi:hypothetical protein